MSIRKVSAFRCLVLLGCRTRIMHL